MERSANPVAGTPEAQELARLQAQMMRPAQHALKDGGYELGWGAACLLFGLGPYLNALMIKAHWLSAWTIWIGCAPLILAAFALSAVPKVIRRFVTWPRTGYFADAREMKLSQLAWLMAVSGAIGLGIGTLEILVVKRIEALGHSRVNGGWADIIAIAAVPLVCAPLILWVFRKVNKKRPLFPQAPDAEAVMRELKRTAAGRKRLRWFTLAVQAVFLGAALLLFGLVFGLMYWNKSLTHHTEIRWFQLGWPSYLVAGSALMYLMGSGVLSKEHRWKWFVLPVMLIAPILLTPALPDPFDTLATTGMASSFGPMPAVSLCLALVWFVSGAITLVLFIRQNPVPPAEACAEMP